MNLATSLAKIMSFFFLLCLFLQTTSCGGEEQEPVYLQLNGVNFTTEAGEGAATEAITSIWVFIDNEFFGAFRPDARVPMLVSGEQAVRFEFGIQENGLSATPNIYEFYQPVTRTIDAVAGTTIDIPALPVRYADNVNFAFIDGFESNEERAFTLVLDGNTALEASSETVLSGQFSGKIELERGASTIFEAVTELAYDDLVGEIGQVWLEVDFRSDASLIWGVVEPVPNGVEPRRFYDPGFVARGEWTKIYFNLTEIIVQSNLPQYRFAMTAFIDDLEQDSGTIYLDNIKVLYF